MLSNANGLGGTPAWTQFAPTAPANFPSDSSGGNTGYDPATNTFIRFHHLTVPGTITTWLLSNGNGSDETPVWQELAVSPQPVVIDWVGGGVYDPGTNKFVFFGGGSPVSNETWTLANANGVGTPQWTQLSPTGTPPEARVWSFAGYAPGTNRLTIYGGSKNSWDGTNEVWVLTDVFGISTVPVAAFSAEVEIEPGPLANDDAFEVKGSFTLGAATDGIAILTEIVSLQLTGGTGAFSATIPAGSFKQDTNGKFKFEGVVDGVSLEVKITSLGNGDFAFKVEGQGADLSGMANPVTVVLTIGNDSGTSMIEAEFE